MLENGSTLKEVLPLAPVAVYRGAWGDWRAALLEVTVL